MKKLKKNTEQVTALMRPLGPKLSMKGYKCKPSIKKLNKMDMM